MIKLFFLTIISLLCVTVFADQYYIDKKGVYLISFPDNWMLEEENTNNVETVTATSPKEKAGDEILEAISIRYGYASPILTIEQWVNADIQFLKSLVKNFTLIEKREYVLSGRRVIQTISRGTLTTQNSFSGLDVQFLDYIFLVENHPLIIRAVSLQGSFPRFQPIFEKIVNSIQFQ